MTMVQLLIEKTRLYTKLSLKPEYPQGGFSKKLPSDSDLSLLARNPCLEKGEKANVSWRKLEQKKSIS